MLSINLTVHNKDFLIKEVLDGISKNTVGTYELVTVLDGCNDNSESILDQFISENPSIKVKKLFADDVFETKSNNIAAKASEGDFIAIVQDDMIITERGWDERMLIPFSKFGDVFSVTSRTSHNWVINGKSEHLNLEKTPPGIWSDILLHVDHAHKGNTPRDYFEIRDSSNRGPLMINHQDFEKLGYLDEDFAPLDMDDHDLHYRALKELGKVTGLFWIDFISEEKWGGTRASGSTAQWHLDANHKNSKLILERHKDVINTRKIETRKI